MVHVFDVFAILNCQQELANLIARCGKLSLCWLVLADFSRFALGLQSFSEMFHHKFERCVRTAIRHGLLSPGSGDWHLILREEVRYFGGLEARTHSATHWLGLLSKQSAVQAATGSGAVSCCQALFLVGYRAHI